MVPGYPKNITEEFNIPETMSLPKRIDAGIKMLFSEYLNNIRFFNKISEAIHWRREAMTYLFHGNYFWKIDEYAYSSDGKPQLTQVGKINESIWHGNGRK